MGYSPTLGVKSDWVALDQSLSVKLTYRIVLGKIEGGRVLAMFTTLHYL